MIITKTRTIVIPAIAALCFAGATALPTVSQAEPNTGGSQSGSDSGGCGGGSSYGDVVEHKNVTTINGNTKIIETWTEVCGKDGKWHKTLNDSPPGVEAPKVVGKTSGTAPVGVNAAA